MHVESDDDKDGGSDVFWPGYVDAVTNLVLNLLFVVVIMTVAVFLFVMELGRKQSEIVAEKEQIRQQQELSVDTPQQAMENAHLKQQVAELQLQVARYKEKQSEAKQSPASVRSNPPKVVTASSALTPPAVTLEKVSGSLVVDFADDAVALTPAEIGQLRTALETIIGGGKAVLRVNVPPGFSEARRLGFYRAMAVRNLLIEMNLPPDRIELAVREDKPGADASLVVVSAP